MERIELVERVTIAWKALSEQTIGRALRSILRPAAVAGATSNRCGLPYEPRERTMPRASRPKGWKHFAQRSASRKSPDPGWPENRKDVTPLTKSSGYQYCGHPRTTPIGTYVRPRMGPLTPLHRFDTIGLKQADHVHMLCAWPECICLPAPRRVCSEGLITDLGRSRRPYKRRSANSRSSASWAAAPWVWSIGARTRSSAAPSRSKPSPETSPTTPI